MPRLASWVVLALLVMLVVPLPAAGMTDEESHDPHNLTWITPHVLAVGGGGLTKDDLAYLSSQGFGAVADFRQEYDDGAANVHAAGMDYLYLPVGTAADITEPMLEQFVAWAKTEAAAGKPIYIHCSNGWHRAPTFAIAWIMATTGLDFDQAAAQMKAAREGVIIRAPGPLLAYDAILEHEPPLRVALNAPTHVDPGASAPVSVRVSAGGAPVEGARVRVWTEEKGVDTTVTTDAHGVATVAIGTVPSSSMEHLFVRANATGYEDGAANPEITVKSSSSTSATGIIVSVAAGSVALGCLGYGAWAWWRRRTA